MDSACRIYLRMALCFLFIFRVFQTFEKFKRYNKNKYNR